MVLDRLYRSEDADSSLIGSILIFGVCILTISMIMLYGVPTISEMQDMAQVQNVEQSFTVFDSRISKAALGESPIQNTCLPLKGGSVNVKGDNESHNQSYVKIQLFKDGNMTDELTCPMGCIEYSYENRLVAYEGGGVWTRYPTGRSVMIAPPEFHYNGETLTLPIMKVKGSSSVGGKGEVDIQVNSNNMPEVLYPNKAQNASRTNPIVAENIVIYIKSEFYDAWADYANRMDRTVATTDEANKTAIIRLQTKPPMGTYTLVPSFYMGMVNQSNLQPMENFSFDFTAKGSEGLMPLNCEISATSGDCTLTYYLKDSNKQLEIEVKYEDTGAGSKYKEYWTGIDTFPIIDKDDSGVDLKNQTFRMKYTPPNPSHGGAHPDFSWDGHTIEDGNITFTLNDLTQHYIKLMTETDSIEFKITEQQSQGKLDFDESEYSLIYDPTGNIITYLHVTINELDTTINN